MRIGKKELVSRLCEQTGMAREQVEKVLNGFDNVVKDALFHGDTIVLPGLLRLNVARVPARVRYNPRTREAIAVPAKKVVRSRISEALQKALQDSYVPHIVVGWVREKEDLEKLNKGFALSGCACTVKPALELDDVADADATVIGPDCTEEDAAGFISGLVAAGQHRPVIRLIRGTPGRPDMPYRDLPSQTADMPADVSGVRELFRSIIQPEMQSAANFIFQRRIAVASSIENIGPLRRDLAEFLPRLAPASVATDVVKALLEGVDNAIQHGNGSNPEMDVELTLRVAKDRIEVTIADQGGGFDYAAHLALLEANDPVDMVLKRDAPRPGGLGIILMKRVFDTLEYISPGNGLRLVKNLPKGKPAAEAPAPEDKRPEPPPASEKAEEAPPPVTGEIEEMEVVEVSDGFSVGSRRAAPKTGSEEAQADDTGDEGDDEEFNITIE